MNTISYFRADSDGVRSIMARLLPEVKKVIFSPPLTIVQWEDDTETRARCDGDEFSEEFGFAMACMRKLFGTRRAFKDQFKDAIRHVDKPKRQKKSKALMIVDYEVKRFNAFYNRMFEAVSGAV